MRKTNSKGEKRFTTETSENTEKGKPRAKTIFSQRSQRTQSKIKGKSESIHHRDRGEHGEFPIRVHSCNSWPGFDFLHALHVLHGECFSTLILTLCPCAFLPLPLALAFPVPPRVPRGQLIFAFDLLCGLCVSAVRLSLCIPYAFLICFPPRSLWSPW